jgi:hypothetical protein
MRHKKAEKGYNNAETRYKSAEIRIKNRTFSGILPLNLAFWRKNAGKPAILLKKWRVWTDV